MTRHRSVSAHPSDNGVVVTLALCAAVVSSAGATQGAMLIVGEGSAVFVASVAGITAGVAFVSAVVIINAVAATICILIDGVGVLVDAAYSRKTANSHYSADRRVRGRKEKTRSFRRWRRCHGTGEKGRTGPYGLTDRAADHLLNHAACTLPVSFQGRFTEEWADHRGHLHGWRLLWWALCLRATATRIGRELRQPEFPRPER